MQDDEAALGVFVPRREVEQESGGGRKEDKEFVCEEQTKRDTESVFLQENACARESKRGERKGQGKRKRERKRERKRGKKKVSVRERES